MRLLRDLPEEKRQEVEAKHSNGDLNLSHLSQVQSHCRDQMKNSEKPVREQVQDKLDLLERVTNTSTRECEQILASLNPGKSSEKEKNKPINAEESRVSFVVSNELLKKIERIQSVRGHQLNEKTVLEVLTLLVNEEIKRDDKKKIAPQKSKSVPAQEVRKDSIKKSFKNFSKNLPSNFRKSRSENFEKSSIDFTKSSPESVPEKLSQSSSQNPSHCFRDRFERTKSGSLSPIKMQTRHISRKTYRALYQEADHQCQFRDPETGKRCHSKYRLQVEHCQPFALGGSNELENLQLFYSTHNVLRAKRVFGFTVKTLTTTI